MRVEVYFNLHKRVFSVRSCKTGRVIHHAKDVHIVNPKFVVRESGRQRVLRERKKNVHAFAVGYIAEDRFPDRTFNWYRVIYNPYKHDYFMLGEDEIPRDWIGTIHMESMHHEHGVASRVYV